MYNMRNENTKMISAKLLAIFFKSSIYIYGHQVK